MLTYGFNVWIEAVVIPFLGIMAAFLFFRYRTNDEANRYFRYLSLSTFLAALLEVSSTLLIDGWGHRHVVNLVIRSVYYVVVNINAYHLMRYVQAYVKIQDRKFETFNNFLLFSSFVVLILNLVPSFSGFFFKVAEDGGLYRGSYNTLWRSVYVLYFVCMAGYLQLANKDAYPSKNQYVIMNVLGLVLILSFVTQYILVREVLFAYAVACIVLFVIFFYYQAPIYRRMNTIEKELEESRRETERSTLIAEAANHAKSDFLANTSHEIRTPMNAILGMNEIILKECKAPDIRQAALDIRRAGNHLLSIINNILDISKIESGKMELYKSDYHLWQLLKDIEESTFEVIHEKKLNFILDVDKNIRESLYGDENRIRQVITNLIDNAVKYTKKGSVTLSIKGTEISHSRVNLTITIKDTGIGIRHDDLQKLFKSFERVNLTETQSIQGAGLGLTLVKYLLNLMGGTIKAESEYGKGSTFTVELPQEYAREEFSGTIGEYEKIIELANEENFNDENNEIEKAFTCPDAKILVVDDTPVNLVVAKGMLKDSLAVVETAESGEECLELLKANNHYDIIFLDHKMPGLDGVETLKAAKELENYSGDTIFIALTAHSGTGLREEYISLGFDDYLAKPIKTEALKKILATYLPENLKVRE